MGNSFQVRAIIRGFGSGQLLFTDHTRVDRDAVDDLMPQLMASHSRLREHDRYLIEIEFPGEEDSTQRFFRFGTDSFPMA